MAEKKIDLAGKDYWDKVWQSQLQSNPIQTEGASNSAFINRKINDYLTRSFADTPTAGLQLLEVGCSASEWLPHFHHDFGFNVHGLDYSEVGCEKARRNLDSSGVQGKVYCADLFAPQAELLDRFDVVVSFGLVEHFADTAHCLFSLGRFLRKDGMLITIIPNMTGLIGFLQKFFDRDVYDVHFLIDREDLHSAHLEAGFRCVETDYFMNWNLGVLNFNNKSDRSWYRPASFVKSAINRVAFKFESLTGIECPNKCTSPYIVCKAIKA